MLRNMELSQNLVQERCVRNIGFSLHTLSPKKGTRRILGGICAIKICIRNINNFRCTRRASGEDLGKFVKTWLSNGENGILYIDANEIIRKGPLGKQLNHLCIIERS